MHSDGQRIAEVDCARAVSVAKRQRADNQEYGPIEANLTVQPEMVFSNIGGKQLLTSVEAQCFLQITFLAQELDVLLTVTRSSMSQRSKCQRTCKRLDDLLTTVLHAASIHLAVMRSQTCPTLLGIQEAISRLIANLETCSATLRQSSEQNWSVAESLLDVLKDGQSVGHSAIADRKRKMAELEEECSQRLEAVIATTTATILRENELGSGTFFDSKSDKYAFQCEGSKLNCLSKIEPLRIHCERLFPTATKTSILAANQTYSKSCQGKDDTSIEFNVEPLAAESQNSYHEKTHAAKTLAHMASINGRTT